MVRFSYPVVQSSPSLKKHKEETSGRRRVWRELASPLIYIVLGIFIHATFLQANDVVLLTESSMHPSVRSESPVMESQTTAVVKNNNNNNNNDKWASLSSSFPPPRVVPSASRSLEADLKALTKWQKQSIERASGKGSMICRSQHKDLREKCEANNAEVAKRLLQEAESSSFLTREPDGYNLKDLTMVVENDMITFKQLSIGYEKIFQGLLLHSASTFMGVSNQQDPADAIAIGDMIWRVKPDLLIELGTSGGGSAFYFSHIMQRYNTSARVLTMDPAAGKQDGTPLTQWNDGQVKAHCPFCEHSTTMTEWRRGDDDNGGPIRFFHGFPHSPEALAIAREAAAKAKTVMVIEDSNHVFENVQANLNAYHDLVTPGSYFLVQDTRLGGPHKAIREFLQSDKGACYDIDKRWEYFIFSQHFDGFLRKRENCAPPSRL